MRLLTVTCAVALSAALGLAVQSPGVATGKTSASRKKATKSSTAKAHSAHKSSPAKSAHAKSLPSEERQAKAAPVAVHQRPPAKPAKSISKTAHRRTSKSSKKPVAVASRRSAQQQPTPERYKEIQQALADRGYLQGAADGNWGADSVEALKRFQRDQDIPDDGKIGSLSLIALGLGPKRAAQQEPSPEKLNQDR